MSQRRQKGLVEGRLRRGETVTVRDIVEAYCELETTPRGKTPSPEAIELVKAKVAEADARHLLKLEPHEDDAASAGSALDALPPGGSAGWHDAPEWYLVAVGDDAELVQTDRHVTVIRRMPGTVLACTQRERAQEFRRRGGANLHVFDSPTKAMLAFGVFEPD